MLQDKEREYKEILKTIKRLVKSPSRPTYTVGFSAGNADKEPGKNTYDYILKLEKDYLTNYQKKLNKLYIFLEKMDEEQSDYCIQNEPLMRSFEPIIADKRAAICEKEPLNLPLVYN